MGRRPGSADDSRDMADISDLLCPECDSGDLITISMTAGPNELSFTSCNLCEAKWWYRDGELVPLASVIGLVSK